MVNKQDIPEWLTELKRGRVLPFTRSEDFFYDLHEVFDLVQEQVQADRKMYSQDWAAVGLAGLAQGCLRKASRLFDLFVMDMPGKDKPEDELRDNMMQAMYAYMYHKMLTEGPRKDRTTYQEEQEPPEYVPAVEVQTPRARVQAPIETVEPPVTEAMDKPEDEIEDEIDDPSEVEDLDSPEELAVPLEQGSGFLEEGSEDIHNPVDDAETESEDEPPPKKALGYI